MISTLLSCFFFMSIVAFVSYQKTKGIADTKDGYFLAGRGLTGVFIAGSMLLTNVSAEHLIGLNGLAYGFNMSSMAWEVTASVATIFMALVLLPRYLFGGFTTLPQFLSDRFGEDVKRITVLLFLVGYGLITIPSVLYLGSIAVLQLFDIPKLLNISYGFGLTLTIICVGLTGAIYAVFGGLKAVAVSDTLNGIGLLIIGITVPLFGFIALGDGDLGTGVNKVLTTHTEKLNAIGGPTDPTPFSTLFTGMIFANLFYWGTNQYVIQRTLGAASLAEGQKGVLYTGYFKLLVPLFVMVPGIISFHLYGDELQSIDLAYPYLVKNVLPMYLSGFFLAVLLGAVFSSFNSLLNSAATLFVLDIYQPFKNTKISDKRLIRAAKMLSLGIALFSFVVAPLLQFAPEGLFQVIRIFSGFYNIPVIAVVLVGLLTKRVPGIAATVAIAFHVIAYAILQFVIDLDIDFLHIYAILFFIEIGIMLGIGYWMPLDKPWRFINKARVDMTPWRYGTPVAITMVSCMIMTYLVFSPVGLVNGVSSRFWYAIATVFVVNALLCWLSSKYWCKKYIPPLSY
tara:strand:+ start:233 stop:1933 length:1701 start_codon:yes stop_codon:yes gene_type:complete